MTARDWMKNVDLAARIAVLVFALAVMSVFIVAGAKKALAASLRDHTIISDDYIRLGDIFDGTKNAEYVLGPAPAPGKDMILNARTLYRIASALDVEWKPSSATEQIVLRREATIMPETEVTAALEDKITQSGVTDKFSITYFNAPSELVLPAGTETGLEITAFRFDPQNDNFSATIVSPSADNPVRRTTTSGKIERLIAVPVLRNALKNGDIIGPMDIDWIELPRNRVANGAATTERDLLNMTPRRTIAAGKTVMLNDLSQPQMVDRGDSITLIFENGPLMLTAKGKALQAGAIGDTVRVSNTDSHKNLQGVVTAHREVTIR